jgi:hypothetical protein
MRNTNRFWIEINFCEIVKSELICFLLQNSQKLNSDQIFDMFLNLHDGSTFIAIEQNIKQMHIEETGKIFN